MNLNKVWSGIKIGLSIVEHLEASGVIKQGKVIKITQGTNGVVTAIDSIITPR